MSQAAQTPSRRPNLDGARRLSLCASHRRSRTAGSAMITGVVQAGEGRIRLTVEGRQGREQEIEAVIDTGYTASLTLPPALIQALGLRWQTVDRVRLADGSVCIFDVYEAKVVWDGKERHILVD